jgi:hypothetical protein
MHDHMISGLTGILIAIAGVAALALLVAGKSNTSGVLTAGGTSIGQMLCTALSPVTGATCGGGGAITIPPICFGTNC